MGRSSAGALTIGSIADVRRARGVVVVVDVMRAFTVVPHLLSRQVRGVVLARTPEHALPLRDRLPGAPAIKGGKPDPAFDGSNSPSLLDELDELDVEGRMVVLSSSTGTSCVHTAGAARRVLCAAFCTARATARLLADEDEVLLVASGDDGRSEEDTACAAHLAPLRRDPDADAAPHVAEAARDRGARQLREAMELGYPGVARDDIDRCLEVDRFAFAVTVEGDLLVARATTP